MIVTVGDAIVDLFAHPRGTAVDVAACFVPHGGGALANVATNVARLGVPARFVGAVGRDAHGDRLARLLAGSGVDISCLVRVPERTAVTFVHVDDDGARAFLFYRSHTADKMLSDALLRAMEPLADATWLVTGTSALVAERSAEALRYVIAEARARAVPHAVDLNVRPHLWSDRASMRDVVRDAVAGAAIVKASEEDMAALELPCTLDALAGFAPGAVPVLTLAERGALARVGGVTLARPAQALAATLVVDATGAGDAFMAGLMATLTRRGAWATVRDDADVWTLALDAGCALGAMAVTEVGATTAVRAPWPEAVTRALEQAPPEERAT